MIAAPVKSSASISRWKSPSPAGSGAVCLFLDNLCEAEHNQPVKGSATASDRRPWKSWESGESDSSNKRNGSHMAQSGGWLQLPTDTHFFIGVF